MGGISIIGPMLALAGVAAVVLVAAKRDGYVFASEVSALARQWPGSDLRWIDSGHAGALLFRGEVLRRAARDAMDRLR